jgi:beta-lactamase superfamily II metal-dependent hydrolase
MPDAITTTKTFEDVLDALEEKNISLTVPTVDDEFKLGNATLKVIYSGDSTNDLNDSSIVLKLIYGNNSFLLTGDATSNVEKELLSKDINTDVLKVGHHGSGYSSTESFLDKVDPKYAVISVGLNNTYNHPTSETLDKLNNRNIKIYRTDQDGTIIFTSDGTDLSVKTVETDTNG